MRYRVQLQSRPTSKDDEYGGQLATWTTDVPLWADIIPLSGNELYAAQAVNAKANVAIHIHNRAGVTTAMRILHGEVVYDIHNVPPVPDRGNGLTLLCSTGLTGG